MWIRTCHKVVMKFIDRPFSLVSHWRVSFWMRRMVWMDGRAMVVMMSTSIMNGPC